MNIRYTIMQKTPRPGEWQPIPLWQVQHAECRLEFNRRHYYERAIRMGDWSNALLWYSHADAWRIVEFWQAKYPFAEFMLIGMLQ